MTTKYEQLYTCNDAHKIKAEIAKLVATQDYKTLHTLLRRNPLASAFDTRQLNEDIPQQDKRFVKRNGKLQLVKK